MAEITEYEYRLSQALDRLSRWAESQPTAPTGETGGETGGGQGDELAAEREINNQLRARIDELGARQNDVIAKLEADLTTARAELAAAKDAAAHREAEIAELATGLEAWLSDNPQEAEDA